jgi:hypothetical protein
MNVCFLDMPLYTTYDRIQYENSSIKKHSVCGVLYAETDINFL